MAYSQEVYEEEQSQTGTFFEGDLMGARGSFGYNEYSGSQSMKVLLLWMGLGHLGCLPVR